MRVYKYSKGISGSVTCRNKNSPITSNPIFRVDQLYGTIIEEAKKFKMATRKPEVRIIQLVDEIETRFQCLLPKFRCPATQQYYRTRHEEWREIYVANARSFASWDIRTCILQAAILKLWVHIHRVQWTIVLLSCWAPKWEIAVEIAFLSCQHKLISGTFFGIIVWLLLKSIVWDLFKGSQ